MRVVAMAVPTDAQGPGSVPLSRKMEVMTSVAIHYGAADPLVLEVDRAALVADLAGPQGVAGADAARLVAAATAAPPDGPPLAVHAVPGDRVVIAVSGSPPQARHVVAAVTRQLEDAGVSSSDIGILHAGPLAIGLEQAREFHPATTAETAYLAADDAARPLHLARELVDADVVVPVGAWAYDAALGGRSLDGELWPAFGRQECLDALACDLARRGRRALSPWLENLQTLTWNLGSVSCLRLVAGRGGTLAGAMFGQAGAAARRARQAAEAWAPTVDRPADLALCSLSLATAGFATIARAVAAAARITRPQGTICIATVAAEPPGTVVTRWRQGAPLGPLLKEARCSGDRDLVADAVVARFLARGLADRRLVLLSGLDEGTVEDLGFGYAATPGAIARLARRSESVAVLHEADLMLPRLAS